MSQNSIWNLLADVSKKGGISEVAINSPKSVFVERSGKFIQVGASLPEADIYAFIDEVAKHNQKECNADNPILDGNLPDGSRINIVLPPYANGYPSISIRRYLKFASKFEDAPDIFGLTPKWITFLKALVRAKANIMISGGTSAGKTTFLNLLLNEIDPSDRVVTIEDTLELSIQSPNHVRLEARGKNSVQHTVVTIRDLMKNSLRMRPDRIIIGESRGGELFDLLQAMNTGHIGSMSTIHSNSSAECLMRMETLFYLAGFDVPSMAIKKQIASGVDFVVQLGRDEKGQRIVTEIMELTGMEGAAISSTMIAKKIDGILTFQGVAPLMIERLSKTGLIPINFFENFKG